MFHTKMLLVQKNTMRAGAGPPGIVGGRERQPPPKISVDMRFFADEPLNVLFLKEETKYVDENQHAKSRASLNTT